jgi:hypothetical protein
MNHYLLRVAEGTAPCPSLREPRAYGLLSHHTKASNNPKYVTSPAGTNQRRGGPGSAGVRMIKWCCTQ